MTLAKVTWQVGIGPVSIPTLQSSGLAGGLAPWCAGRGDGEDPKEAERLDTESDTVL